MAHNSNAAAASKAEEISQGAGHNSNTAAQATAIVQVVVNAENRAAAIAELIPLQRVLHTIVGLTCTQFVAMAADWYEDFLYFDNVQWDST